MRRWGAGGPSWSPRRTRAARQVSPEAAVVEGAAGPVLPAAPHGTLSAPLAAPPPPRPTRPRAHRPAGGPPRGGAALDRYWRSNVRIMLVLLSVWALAGLGCGVLLADWLNGFRIGGAKLGFWFAQQGSILVFVALILVYAALMARLDRRHHEELERLRRERGEAPERGGEA